MVGMFDTVLLLPLEGEPGQRKQAQTWAKGQLCPWLLCPWLRDPRVPGAGTRPVEGGPSHPSVPWPVATARVCACTHIHGCESRDCPCRGQARCWPGCWPPRGLWRQPHGRPSVCSTTDVHTVASLLKLYLRELPEPVVPFSRYEDFLSCAQLLTKDEGEVSGSRGPCRGSGPAR